MYYHPLFTLHFNLYADDGLDADLAGVVVESDGAVEAVVVGEGE